MRGEQLEKVEVAKNVEESKAACVVCYIIYRLITRERT
jgi:hypothetical protein